MNDRRIRNVGLVPSAVAGRVAGKTVAIAGVGGVGGSVVIELVRQLGLAKVKLADPDAYDVSNLNRQAGAFASTMGLSKVKVISQILRDIDPELEIETFDEGVNASNLDDFLDGSDLLVDAVDFTAPEIHLALAAGSRQRSIPMVLGVEIGYGARAVWFDPAGMTFERYFRLTAASQELELRRMIMRLPAYVDLKALKAIGTKAIEAPAIATGGAAVSALLVPLVEALLSGLEVPSPAPVSAFVDTKERVGGQIHHSTLVWWSSLARVIVRTKLGKNLSAL